jgi:hypothetical protein
MPPSSSILTATIGVTFVGPKNIPQKTMPGFLRMNQNRVRIMLEWLKANNPLYHHIIISPSRLDALPSNDVPLEIFNFIRQSENINVLADVMTRRILLIFHFIYHVCTITDRSPD